MSASQVQIDLEKCIDVSDGDPTPNHRTLLFVTTNRSNTLTVTVLPSTQPDMTTTLFIVIGPKSFKNIKPDNIQAVPGDDMYGRYVGRCEFHVNKNKPAGVTVYLINGSDLLVELEALGTRCPLGDQMDVQNVRSDTRVTLHWLQDSKITNEALTSLHTETVVPYGYLRMMTKPPSSQEERKLTPRQRLAFKGQDLQPSGPGQKMIQNDYIGWLTSVPRFFINDADKHENHVILLNGLIPSAFTRVLLLVPKPNMHFITHEHFPDELQLFLVRDMGEVRNVLMKHSRIVPDKGINLKGSLKFTADMRPKINEMVARNFVESVTLIRSRGQDFWRDLRGKENIDQDLISYWQQTSFHDFFIWETADPKFEKQVDAKVNVKKVSWDENTWRTRHVEVMKSNLDENIPMNSESFFTCERRGDDVTYHDLWTFSQELTEFSTYFVRLTSADLATADTIPNQVMEIGFTEFQRTTLEGNRWSRINAENWHTMQEKFDNLDPRLAQINDTPFPVFPRRNTRKGEKFEAKRDGARAVYVKQERQMIVHVLISDDMPPNVWYGARTIPRNVKVYLVSIQCATRAMFNEHKRTSGGDLSKVFYRNEHVLKLPVPGMHQGVQPPRPAQYMGSGYMTLTEQYDQYVIFVKNNSLITEMNLGIPAQADDAPRKKIQLFVVVETKTTKPLNETIAVLVDQRVRQHEIHVTAKSVFLHWVRRNSTPLFDINKDFPLVNYMKAFRNPDNIPLTRSLRTAGQVNVKEYLQTQRNERTWAVGQGPMEGQAAAVAARINANINLPPNVRVEERRSRSRSPTRDRGRSSRDRSGGRSYERDERRDKRDRDRDRRDESRSNIDNYDSRDRQRDRSGDRDRRDERYGGSSRQESYRSSGRSRDNSRDRSRRSRSRERHPRDESREDSRRQRSTSTRDRDGRYQDKNKRKRSRSRSKSPRRKR